MAQKQVASAPLSDTELVASASAGDKDAFALLVERHRPTALHLVNGVARNTPLANDLVQDATLTAYLSLGQLRDPERFGPWLCGIALNLCRNNLRQSRAESPIDGILDASTGTGPEDLIEEKELRGRVMSAVEQLPGGMRAATLLFYYRQMTVVEVAESLGISASAVKVRLNRARIRLREQFAVSRPVAARSTAMQKVFVADVVPTESESGTQHVVILATESGDRALPIWVGRDIGAAIALGARSTESLRPMTFAFITALLEAAGATISQVQVDRLEGDTFYATVDVSGASGKRQVDSRPSDAIALAVRTGSPIFVSDEVMASAGMDVPEGRASTSAGGQRLDALVSEIEESFHRPGTHPVDETKRQETYRQLAETVFGEGT